MDTLFTMLFYTTGGCLAFIFVTAVLCVINPSMIDNIRNDMKGKKP